jgi:hypothetical protein
VTQIKAVGGPSSWRGEELRDSDEWIVELGDEHRAELLAALAGVENEGLDFHEIDIASFPLPSTGPLVESLLDPLLDGRGFVLLRGVPIDGLSERQIELLYWGIGLRVGVALPQGATKTDYFAHVRDEGVDRNANYGGGLLNRHSGALPFHTDSSDLVGLLCINPAMRGGLSTLASAVAVHDEALRRRPDLVELMYEPWWFDRKRGDGPDSFAQCPIFGVNDEGRFFTFYGPDLYRTAQRADFVPPLTEAHHEALALVDEIAGSPEFRLDMDVQRGEIQFANNYLILHSRSAYEDYPDPALRRDLIRFWLTIERDPGLPPSFAERGINARRRQFTG